MLLMLSWAGCSQNERSARLRLQQALQASKNLRAEAVHLPTETVKQACLVPLDETPRHRIDLDARIVDARFATLGQAKRYSEARPWFGAYAAQ